MTTPAQRAINNWLLNADSTSIRHLFTGEIKKLGEYQFQLLQTFAENPGKIFTREELTNIVWKNRLIGNNSLPNAIHMIRVALGDNGKHQSIVKTIPKQGYMLNESFCENIEHDASAFSDEEFATEMPLTQETANVPMLAAAVTPSAFHQDWLWLTGLAPVATGSRPKQDEHQAVNSRLTRWSSYAIALLLVALLGAELSLYKQRQSDLSVAVTCETATPKAPVNSFISRD